jgi:hypothetical protein
MPDRVRARLAPCPVSGLPARTRLNVRNSDLVLVLVPDRRNPWATPGTRQTLRYAREHGVASLAVDPDTAPMWHRAFVLDKRAVLLGRGFTDPMNLMIAGPRASLWPDGEREAQALVGDIARAWKVAP